MPETDSEGKAAKKGLTLAEAVRAAHAGVLAWPAFNKVFLGSAVYVPTSTDVPAAGNWRTTATAEAFSISVISHAGHDYVPIFSSLEELERSATGHQAYVQMPAADLLPQLPPNHWLILDPAGEFPKELSPQDVQALLGSREAGRPVVLEAGTRFVIGHPPDDPVAIKAALRTKLATLPEVQEAYLAQITLSDAEETPHLLIGVRFKEPGFPRADSTFDKLHLAIAPLLQEGEIVDFTAIGPGSSAANYYLTGITPFYSAEPRLDTTGA